MPCCCGKCRCLRAHDYSNPTFKWSAWIRMTTLNGFVFGTNGSLARNVSLETSSYFVWSQAISPAGNPPYYLLGVLRLGKNGSRRPRFLVLIDDSVAPTITDAGDLGAMPAGKEGALYECTKDGWVLLDYTEYTGAWFNGATDDRFGVKFEGSNVDAVGQRDGTSSANPPLLPIGVVCTDPIPLFPTTDPPDTIVVEWSGWPGAMAYLNGINRTLTKKTIGAGFPSFSNGVYEIYEYWFANPAGGHVADQSTTGLPGHEIYPLGTNGWSWNALYYRPVLPDYVPLIIVRMCWQVCTDEFEGNSPSNAATPEDTSGTNGFSPKNYWEFFGQYDHPDDDNESEHWTGVMYDSTWGGTGVVNHPVFAYRHDKFIASPVAMGTIASVT